MTDTPPDSHPVTTVPDKGVRPPGILPRNAQAWVIGGISLLMVIVIAFSGRKEPKEPSTVSKVQASATLDPNEARIQEYRARIEEQARKLTAEQSQLVQTKQTYGIPSDAAATRQMPPYAVPGGRLDYEGAPA